MPSAGTIVFGLVQGSIAGLNALGLVLLWRTTRLVNLAQVAMGLVGGVLTGLLVVVSHWSFWWAAPTGLMVGALLGFGTDRIVMRRMKDAPRAVMLVATVGLAGVFAGIQTGLPFAFTGRALPSYQIPIGMTFTLGTSTFSGADIVALMAFPLALAAALYFLYRTRFGLAALALGQDAERARALGVSASLVRSMVWAVAGVLATISGILTIPIFTFDLGGSRGGTIVLLLSLGAAVLAGFRSLLGTAAAALGLGIAYNIALSYTDKVDLGNLVFVAVILIAVTLQRKRLGRSESAARASSWEAAVTMRPLAWAVSSARRLRVGAVILLVVLLAAAIVPPLLLGRSIDLRYLNLLYAKKAAYALTTLSIAFAWMFAGEVVLGQWGIAGLGAAVSGFMPGPAFVRVLAAAIAMGFLGGALGFASRRQSSLSFAVLGLAAAGAAPYIAANLAPHPVTVDATTICVILGALVVLVTAGMTKLRGTMLGAQMIAARDDPQRAPWLGADPVRSRVIALGISGAIAGLAGALYIATFTTQLSPDVFNPTLSLDILMYAVIGGLGSPAGALLGAIAVLAGQTFLPGAWGLLTSGLGVLLVVIFKPAGLGRGLEWVRDRFVAALVPVTGQAAPPPSPPVAVKEAVA